MHQIIKRMEKINPKAVKLDNLDECIVGICETYEGARFLYSEKAIIKSYIKKGMSEADALKAFEQDIFLLNTGEYKPIFLIDLGE